MYYNVSTMKYKGSTMKKAINIRLDEALLSDLDNYAKELDRTRTYIIEKAVGTYFDILDEMISDKRIDDVKKGNIEVFSLEQVSQQLGLI
jgi:predicted transcriptional regulator